MNKIVVGFGGGTNTTAMLIGMRDNGIIPDRILFADTQAELPHTYEHLEVMKKWCEDNRFPAIEVVKRQWRDGSYKTLEQECLDRKILPAPAYSGFHTCSMNYKVKPQEKYLNSVFKEYFKAGNKFDRYVGFDAGEDQRVSKGKTFNINDPKYKNQYPLYDEWMWSREDCVNVILKEGLKAPGKSSCFFCPNMKKREIIDMYLEYPEYYERAIAIERNAKLTKIKGLGRNWSWEEFVTLWQKIIDDKYAEITDNDQIIELAIQDTVKAMSHKRKREKSDQSDLCDFMKDSDMPCGCYD